MNRREAKRWACGHAASVLRTALGEGWPHNDLAPQPGDERAEHDADLVSECIGDLCGELERRGGLAHN